MKVFIDALHLIFTGILVGASSELNMKFEEREILIKLEHLTSEVIHLDKENKQLKSAVEGIEEVKLVVKEIDRENKRLQHGYRELVDINERLQAEMQNLNSCVCSKQHSNDTLTSLKRFLLDNGDLDTTSVAFTVAVNRHLTLGPNQAVQFEKVITNVGGAYDPKIGRMMVPIKGLYLVSVTIFNQKQDEVNLELVLNGNELVYFYAQGENRYSSMSQTLIVSLEKGDAVWLRNHDSTQDAGHHLYGSNTEWFNTFSAILLKPY